jgi:hypothetical protein
MRIPTVDYACKVCGETFYIQYRLRPLTRDRYHVRPIDMVELFVHMWTHDLKQEAS